MNKIIRVSRILRIVLVVFFIGLPVLTGLSWLFFEKSLELGVMDQLLGFSIDNVILTLPLAPLSRGLGFLAAMIPTGLDMLVLWYLIKLFSLYARGEIFSANNVRYIRLSGLTLLIGKALFPVYQSLVTLALTAGNPPGQHMIAVGLSSSDISGIVTGVMIMVVAWIMDQGRLLQEENALVI